jgi:hypothetical protein
MITPRRALSFGIIAYLAVWAGAVVFAYHVFGSGLVIGLSLILVLPFAVAARVCFQRQSIRKRDFVFLSIVTALAIGGSIYVVGYWYDKDMDRVHAADVRFELFTRLAREYPEFHKVEFSRGTTITKDRYQIRGTVASEADLDRLQSLRDRFDLSSSACWQDVTVNNESQRPSKQ